MSTLSKEPPPSPSELSRHRAPRWLLWTFLVVLPVAMIPLNLWYIPSGIWRPIFDASRGLVHPTLLGGLALWVSMIGLLVIVCGRLHPRAVGLRLEDLRTGILGTVGVWLALQLFAGVGSGVLDGKWELTDNWTVANWTFTSGKLLGQLFGNAMAEELLYRGFLLLQLVWIFQSSSKKRPALLAIVIAAAVFAVLHIPNRVLKGFDSLESFAFDQLALFVFGLIMGWAYWRTQNLFLLVGLHGLANRPSMLFQGPDAWPDQLWGVLVLVSLAIFAWVGRKGECVGLPCAPNSDS